MTTSLLDQLFPNRLTKHAKLNLIIENIGELMASIAELKTAVDALAPAIVDVTAAVDSLRTHGTTLTAEDQAVLDAAVSGINTAVAELQSVAHPPTVGV